MKLCEGRVAIITGAGRGVGRAYALMLAEHGAKVSAGDKSAIEGAIAELKAALGTDNMSDIAAKTQTLIQASMKLGEAMYASGASSEAGDDSDGDSKDSGVVDAEFEEVDGNNKKSA